MNMRSLLFAALCSAAAAHASAQELSLSDALYQAGRGAYANRVADAQVRTQSAQAGQALGGILPALRVETGFSRTTDPIGTFGMTLRQRTIAAPDFDPARLNFPAPRSDYGAALILEQPLINVDAHLGRRAAAHATAATHEQAEWVRSGTSVDVVRAYYGAVLVAEHVMTLEAAQRVAEAHVQQAKAMARQGLVTRSDELLAQVRAGEVDAQLVEARGEAALATRRLALLLGTPADTLFTLPQQLPSSATLQRLDDEPWTMALAARADVRAAREGEAAARTDVRRARATLLPRLNAVGRYDWHSSSSPFAGDESWSVGVMATWSPFAGASQQSEIRMAAGRAAAATAQAEAALAAAAVEADAAANAWRVALHRVSIAEAAVEQSEEASRIVTRKYEGGLAGVTELLGASTAATESRLRYARARYDATVAAAERLQRAGLDPADLAGLLDRKEPTADSGD